MGDDISLSQHSGMSKIVVRHRSTMSEAYHYFRASHLPFWFRQVLNRDTGNGLPLLHQSTAPEVTAFPDECGTIVISIGLFGQSAQNRNLFMTAGLENTSTDAYMCISQTHPDVYLFFPTLIPPEKIRGHFNWRTDSQQTLCICVSVPRAFSMCKFSQAV